MAKKTEAAADNTVTSEASQAPVQKALPVKKVSIKEVAGDIKKWFTENRFKGLELEKKFESGEISIIPIARIYGRVLKTRPGSGDHGPFVRFDGKFFGVDLMGVKAPVGTLYTGNTCLLPKWLEAAIDAAYSENGEAVMFGFDIFLKHAPSASLGYEFVSETLIDAGDDMAAQVSAFPVLPGKPEVMLLSAPK